MAWTLTTSGAALSKAGANATISSAALIIWSNQAEATLSTITRKDWVADYANVTANFKNILSDVVSDMIAMNIVKWDMSGYTSRTEAETILDVLRDNIARNVEILRDVKYQEIMD